MFPRQFLLIVFALSAAHAVPAAAEDKHEDQATQLQILGWVENAYLIAPGFDLSAKLDTGANTSSLDARIIKRFRQWGRRWVRFAVMDRETGEEVVMVRERERTIGIVRHEGENDVRPTVSVEICIAGLQRNIEVSLVDRSNFNYPLLLGRRAMKEFAVVDSSATFLGSEPCPDSLDRSGIVLDPSASDPDADRPRSRNVSRKNRADSENQLSETHDEDRDEDVEPEDDNPERLNS